MAEDWRELLPAAFLLAGSDAGARDLLVRGLARRGGVDGLVHAHLRRRFDRDGVLAATDAPWWVSPADAETAARLSAALDGLGRAERAAVVLHWFEQLPRAEVARRVPGVDLPSLPGRLGVPEADLPARLELLAGTAQPADLDDAAVAGRVRAVRARRRGRVLLGSAATLALVAGVVWLPRVVPAPTPSASTSPPVPQLLLDTVSARGSLVDDGEFVGALQARVGSTPGLQLLYAGDGVGHRWALLVVPLPGGTDVHWFTGPRGTAAADLVPTDVGYGGDPPPAWSIAVPDGTGTTVIVVARDGDGVEVSGGVDVAPDGRVSRTFVPNAGLDGVVTVPVARPSGTGTRFRVVRDGRVIGTGTTLLAGAGGDPTPPAAPPRSGPGPVDDVAFAVAVQAVTGPTGWGADDLDLVVLGAGSHPAPGGRPTRAVTVAATLPDGAVVTSTAETVGGLGQTCGTQIHPAGTDLATLTVATRCPALDGDVPAVDHTVVVAPPGAQVVLVGSGPDAVAPALDGGWGVVTDGPDDLTAFAVDGVAGVVPPAGDSPLDRA